MPFLYITGVDADGRSCVVERRDLDEIDYLIAWQTSNEGNVLPVSRSEAKLVQLDAEPPAPGQNRKWSMMAWEPGKYSIAHRSHTVDYDTVLVGSVDLELEAETLTLHAGDCVLVNGTVHAWRARDVRSIVSYVGIGAIPPPEDAALEAVAGSAAVKRAPA